MRDISPSVFVRGLQRANQRNPEFWVQIGFSGCAGEAETSARVATHWTALWHQAEARRIAEQCLIRFGFAPEPYTSDETEPMCFLPAGELGYLEYIPSERRSKWQPAFEVDNAVAEAWPGDPVLEQLEGSFGKYMTESRCRCQLCEPAFPGAVIG